MVNEKQYYSPVLQFFQTILICM